MQLNLLIKTLFAPPFLFVSVSYFRFLASCRSHLRFVDGLAVRLVKVGLAAALLVQEDDGAQDDHLDADAQERPQSGVLVCGRVVDRKRKEKEKTINSIAHWDVDEFETETVEDVPMTRMVMERENEPRLLVAVQV